MDIHYVNVIFVETEAPNFQNIDKRFLQVKIIFESNFIEMDLNHKIS